MKKGYEKPEIEIVKFEIANSIMDATINPDTGMPDTSQGVEWD